MKKGLLFLMLVANCFAYDADVFKDGFEAGLKALQFQIKNDGAIPQKIILDKGLIVILPIESISINEVIYIQYIANKEDFRTHLTKEGIIFGNYDRQVDAKEAQQRVKRVLNYDTKIIANKGDLYTNPIIAKPIYDLIAQELVEEGAIRDVKVVYVNNTPKATTPIQPVKKEAKEQSNIRNAGLKNAKAQAYKVTGDDKNSANYEESFIAEGVKFKTTNTIVTDNGEVFVKVLNENTYFLKSDVEFL
jgi:hypothetical protein